MARFASAAASGSSFDDSGNSNRILAVVTLLVVIAVALIVFTWWYWRSTRPEPEALAPLELLSLRKARQLTPEARRRALDQVRPRLVDDSVAPAALVVPVDLAALAARDLPPLAELQPDPPAIPPPPVVPPAPVAAVEPVVAEEPAVPAVVEAPVEDAEESVETA